VNEEAATQVFYRDCLIPLGTCIAPVGHAKAGSPCLRVRLTGGGRSEDLQLNVGEMRLIPLPEGERAEVTLDPVRRFDVGAGPGRALTATVQGGVVGVVIDARGRPLQLPEDDAERIAALRAWNAELEVYPSNVAAGEVV
ncbi:unnamed protein product, partial [marine sediment metagenome]